MAKGKFSDKNSSPAAAPAGGLGLQGLLDCLPPGAGGLLESIMQIDCTPGIGSRMRRA
jgi:hypothetical protein